MSRRRATRRGLLASSGAILLGGAGGCLERNGSDENHELGQPETYVEVTYASGSNGVRLEPSVVHLVEGGTVEWVSDRGDHDATTYHPATHGDRRRIPEDAEPWASGPLADANGSFDRVFELEGVYDYACTTYEADGAVGTVVVGWPDPDDEAGLEPPAARPDAAAEGLERLNDRVRTTLEAEHDDDGILP